MSKACVKCGGRTVPFNEGRVSIRHDCCPACTSKELGRPVRGDDPEALERCEYDAFARSALMRDANRIADELERLIERIEAFGDEHPGGCDCFACTRYPDDSGAIVDGISGFLWAAHLALSHLEGHVVRQRRRRKATA